MKFVKTEQGRWEKLISPKNTELKTKTLEIDEKKYGIICITAQQISNNWKNYSKFQVLSSNQIAQNNYVINYRDFEKGFPAIFKTNLFLTFPACF